MEILAKSRIATFLALVAASSAAFAQNSGPVKPQNRASVLDARQIVSLSVVATERSWQARDHYIYTERDDDQRLDSLGHVKSENVDVSKMIVVNGARFEQLMEHNGQLPSATEQKKSKEDLDKLKHESTDDRIARSGRSRKTGFSSATSSRPSTSTSSAKRQSTAGQPTYFMPRRIPVITRTANTLSFFPMWKASSGLTSKTSVGSRWTAT